MASTTRKRALPLIMRSYASVTRSSGKTSFIGRTPVRALKASVSSESIDVPEYQPLIERQPLSRNNGDTCIDAAAPMTDSVPLTARPPWTALIASPRVLDPWVRSLLGERIAVADAA